VQRDVTVKSHENISGHHETFTSDRDVTMSGEFDNRVMELLNGVLQEREARENDRANHRNLNRMLTLFGALAIGLIVTYVLTTPGLMPASMKWLAPYTFVITILLDSGLALYGYIRKY
jgi:hypothetical protein